MIEFDHVILAVTDLDDAAAIMRRAHGLESLPGGRHRGHGTGNRIIPLGSSYIELMAVVDPDEAQGSPLGRWVVDAVRRDHQKRALCLRTDDIGGVAARLGVEPLPMSRVRPDGVEMSWRLAGLDQMLVEGSPFFIQWQVDDANHPARSMVAHQIDPGGITWVEIGNQSDVIEAVFDEASLDIRKVAGIHGVGRIGVGRGSQEIVI